MNLKDIDYLSIHLASPEDILSWSYGEVTKPETLNYRTQRPEKEGLFSERIFGPTRDYECYCGKYKKVRYKGVVCERCGVEVTHSSVRRERMGHISLAVPVANVWFLRTIPSKIGIMLDVPVQKLEQVVYYAAYIVISVDEEARKRALQTVEEEYKALKNEGKDLEKLERSREESSLILKNLKPGMLLSQASYYRFSQKFGEVFEAGRGAEAVRKLLEAVDLRTLTNKVSKELEETTDAGRRKKLLRRLRMAKSMLKSGVRPEWMVMTVVPVLPPELRPMVALDGGRYATADLNDLYRRVINRNNRLKRLIELNSPEVIIVNEKRMLQEAVDALIDNSKHPGTQVTGSRKRPLKSLSDMLKGKQGRFRRNLLGKRVDYSARSVIVVGPELKMHECALPKKLALEMARPFVIHELIKRGIVFNIKQANRLIEQGSPEVWAALEEAIKDKKVLLNRAPSLHRLSIQAFTPLLSEDLAIRIHPLVCTAFNADFDGDQMAVHLPLTAEAQYESRTLLNAATNLLKPANGDPIVSPSQDIVLGIYYLTSEGAHPAGEKMKRMSSMQEALLAYEHGTIGLQEIVKVRIGGELIETTCGRIMVNKVLPPGMPFVNKQLNKNGLSKVIATIIEALGVEGTAEYLDLLKNLGFRYSTLSATSFAITDAVTPPAKEELLKKGDAQVAEIEEEFEEGLLTDEERFDRVVETWTGILEELGKRAPERLKENPKNPVYRIIDSKARGSWSQLNQIVGMRGLLVNPKNEIIELPVKSSYREGLRILEYFISTHGARKGLTDTALKTASAGYLTRRLVDVAQDVLVHEDDCRTRKGIEIVRADGDEYGYDFGERLYSRTSLEDIKVKGKVIVKAGECISREAAKQIEESDLAAVKVRSPITCRAERGLCAKCYGLDLATGRLVEKGEAVGVVAAQSIGEPGTQLTLRTFHIGGVAGVDITHGLPRVEEIFEARAPKGKAALVKNDGVVADIEERELYRVVSIAREGVKTVDEYLVPRKVRLFVKKGDGVKKGDVLCEGNTDLREVLKYRGIEAAKRYIVNEVQKIYVPEGSPINDKHIEIIARKMFSRVVVKDGGDTGFIAGELVDRSKLERANRDIRKRGEEPAKASQKIMGITKVALTTESFLSAASFQETGRVLVNAAIEGKVDKLSGLKENVIIGKLVPAGTGLRGIPEAELPKRSSDDGDDEGKKETEKVAQTVEG